MDRISFLEAFMEEIWNNKNKDVVEKYVHAEYKIHLDAGDPWEGKILSHEEFKKRLAFSFNSFPDIHFNIQSVIADGDHVAITWVMTGTNLGSIGDLPPTNKFIETNGMTIYHFKEDKINGHTQVFDRNTVFKQLGYI